VCVVWSVGRPKGKTKCVCVCVRVCVGLRPRHMLSIPSTKLNMECGANQRENNRKMERVCVVWSVGQPKGKNNKKNRVWGSSQEKQLEK